MKITKILIVAVLSTLILSCQQGGLYKGVKTLENEVDSVSYAVGLNLTNSMRINFKEMNEEAFIQAIKDGLDSVNFKLDPKKVQTIMNPYFQKKRQKEMKERQAKAKELAEANFADNRKAGEDFLAENKSKKGVKTTPSGLQYRVMKEGKGELVKPTDRIKIHYHGTTIDGTVFDSTVDRNKPYESQANVFVLGFSEGLRLMKKGSKYKFFIPQELAYGYQQKGPKIPPFSALIFEVEILEINGK
jgi:FKBP-type peptidyl-prolyl cis-trans isomerase FklB